MTSFVGTWNSVIEKGIDMTRFTGVVLLCWLVCFAVSATPISLESDSATFSLTIPDADFDGILDADDPNPENPDSDSDGIPDGADGDVVDIEITSSSHPDVSLPYPNPDAVFHISTLVSGLTNYKYLVDNTPITRLASSTLGTTSASANPSSRDITYSVTVPGTYYFHIVGSNASGTIVTKTSTRAFRVSSRYIVPDVVGMQRSSAESALIAAGLSVGTIAQEWNDNIPAGQVLTQSVSPGATMSQVGPISLTISRGRVTDTYKYGDVNMDGAITVDDYGTLLLVIGTVDPIERLLADVNHDGSVDLNDAQLLLTYLRSGEIMTMVRRVMAQSGASEVLLLWAPIPHDNVAKYRVYRSEDDSEPRMWTNLGETPDTVFSDKNVESRTYYYRVSFVDTLGNEGGYSQAVRVVANTIILNIPTVWGKPDDEVRVPINLGNARGLVPKGMYIKLTYNSDAATPRSSDPVMTTALTRAVDFFPTTTKPGEIVIISQDALATLPDGEGRFFDIYLKLKSSAPQGCTPLNLAQVTLADPQGKPITTQTISGNLCVGDDGQWGDMNNDGVVTEEDAVIALEIAVEKTELALDDPRNMRGDMNGDGMIDAADAVMILRLARNLTSAPRQMQSPHRLHRVACL